MKINEFIPGQINPGNVEKTKINENKDTKNKKVNFGETFKEKLSEVNDKQVQSNELAEKFIKGEDVEVHELMLKTEEAKLSLQLAVQVRNKLMEAYQEFNRMQV